MTPVENYAVSKLAESFAKFIPANVLGDLLNYTLMASDAELTDNEVSRVEAFHHALGRACPAAVDAAMCPGGPTD